MTAGRHPEFFQGGCLLTISSRSSHPVQAFVKAEDAAFSWYRPKGGFLVTSDLGAIDY
jgi:hypothetical protein